MYVKRELARVLYYDMFEKGRVVIKQGKRIDKVEKVSICPMLGKPRQSWILDSPPWIPDSRYIGFRIFGQWNLITIFSGIPDRLNSIKDSKPQEKMFGFPHVGRDSIASSRHKNKTTFAIPFCSYFQDMLVYHSTS